MRDHHHLFKNKECSFFSTRFTKGGDYNIPRFHFFYSVVV